MIINNRRGGGAIDEPLKFRECLVRNQNENRNDLELESEWTNSPKRLIRDRNRN